MTDWGTPSNIGYQRWRDTDRYVDDVLLLANWVKQWLATLFLKMGNVTQHAWTEISLVVFLFLLGDGW